jgi:hypothetical protein
MEAAELADRALRLDPHMPPSSLNGVKDAYFMARRYEDTIAAVVRQPEENRQRDGWVHLAASYAWLGQGQKAAEARTKLLQAFPTVSAERLLNEDYVFLARRTRITSSMVSVSRVSRYACGWRRWRKCRASSSVPNVRPSGQGFSRQVLRQRAWPTMRQLAPRPTSTQAFIATVTSASNVRIVATAKAPNAL